MKPILIDGSYGEGGGSIFRYALALSSVTLKPIEIHNIRAKRSNPGLRPQHLTAAKILAQMTEARFEGLSVGSTRVRFEPKKRKGGRYVFDIGTAGSISLIIQAVLPVALFADRESTIEIRGGTDVRFAPPIDYMRNVFIKNLAFIGVDHVEISVRRRGHYPRGGGLVTLKVQPIEKIGTISIEVREPVSRISGIAHAVKLPKHVVERIISSTKEALRKHGYEDVEIAGEWSPNSHLGPGAGITIFADAGTILGADSLGERGKPSEKVGKEAAERLILELKTKKAFDQHMGDMIIPYLAMAGGSSLIGVSKYTLHAESNLWLTKQILNAGYEVNKHEDGSASISIRGVGI
ncbi:MAG TPA: RNA 3'-terminal phosphate cyclase [Candidatus Korarchaeota archaeon]|nr:RNA 3'-terminal phosphate cyclase [Candidatus Korarchaeota archaeon]